MHEFSLTLKNLLDKLKNKQEKNRLYILQKLNKLLTKKEFQHIKYISFYKDILKLGVDSSAWLYYFNQKREQILQELKIKEIKFYLA